MSLIRTVVDWETAYGVHPVTGENVTLSKMTTEEYVRHPLFKAHGLGVKIGQERAFYLYKPDDLLHFLRTHPWSRSFTIAHHSHFDGAILTWRAGITPRFWGDTLSMGRAIFPNEAVSLGRLSVILGLGEKGTELASFRGKWSLTDEEQAVMGRYCCNDVELTSKIFDALKGHFPADELRLIDWTVRAFTEPAIAIDGKPLIEAYKAERKRKRTLVAQCVSDKEVLASNDQFAQLLIDLGVDPPKKVSPAKIKDGRVDKDMLGEPPFGLLPSFKATKDMTSEERITLKEEKKVYPWSYAFGKTDEGFKLLQDHPDPKVQAVIEARLGIKSTIKETRTKRYYKIGKRGLFPVYLNYYGGHTGRWSGGDKQNAQNLNRVDSRDPTSGALRMSWTAPKGHVIAVRDQGQIEARQLSYVAGQEDMLDMFRAGGDPYDFMAGKVYGRKVDRKHVPEDKNPGQVGKIIVLGCLGPDTIVITNHGCKKIIDVRHSDMVWDGVEYVSHLGIKYQGEKECLTHAGLSATPDHEILTEHGWQEWSEVRMRHFLFRSAIRKASLLSLSGEDPLPDITRTSNARAAIGRWYTGLILLVEEVLDAIFVLKKRVGQLLRSIGGMLLLSRTITIENDFSTAFHPAFSGAKTTETTNTKITEREGYEYVKRGLMTGKNFLNTLPLLKVGTWRITNWIGSITTKAMSLVTCVFAAKRTTSETEEQSSSSRKRLPTYDVLCAGPRNCFAVMTDYGPIIVHNCGYQMGAWKLQENIRVGFMGMPGFLFGQDYVDQLGVDVEAFCFQKSYKKGFRYAKDEAEACKPMNVSLTDHLTHCAVTKFLIDTFRRENGSVVALWKESQASLDLIIAGSKDVQVGARGLVFTCEEGLVLPNGMKLRYNKLRKTSDGKGYKYLANVRKKEWTNIYGGKVVENIVQALSRIIISDQLLRVQNNLNGYDRRQGEVFKAASTTHDEIICLVPERVANDCLDMMGREMRIPPKWCPDIPLKSSGGFAFRYGECEK